MFEPNIGRNFQDFEEKIITADHYRRPSYWGAFIINNGAITIQQWGIGMCRLNVYVSSGHVLNDTTFFLHEKYKIDDFDVRRPVDEVYHFRQHNWKPDSSAQRWL